MHGSSVYKLDFRFQQCSSTNVYTHTISSVIFYFIIIFYIVPFHSMLIPACHLFTAPFLPLILWFSVILSLGVLFTFHTFSLFSFISPVSESREVATWLHWNAYFMHMEENCIFRVDFGGKKMVSAANGSLTATKKWIAESCLHNNYAFKPIWIVFPRNKQNRYLLHFILMEPALWTCFSHPKHPLNV